MIPGHRQSISHDVGIISITFGRNGTPLVDWVQTLQFLEAQLLVCIKISFTVKSSLIIVIFDQNGVYKEVKDILRPVDPIIMELLHQLLDSDSALSILICTYKCIFQWVDMSQFYLKSPDALLDLKLLGSEELILT